ncbi:hypothetical protein IAR50_006086 [Cryptococcus sp. DSM 104548]
MSRSKRTHSALSSIADTLFPHCRYPDPRVTHPSAKTGGDELVIKMQALLEMSDRQETEYHNPELDRDPNAPSLRFYYTEPYIDPDIDILEEGSHQILMRECVSNGAQLYKQPLVPTKYRTPGQNFYTPWPLFPLTISARSVGARRKPMYPRSALSSDVFDMTASRIPTDPDEEDEWQLQVKHNVIIPGTLRSVFDVKEAAYFDGLQDAGGERWKLDRIEWTAPGSSVSRDGAVNWEDEIPESDWIFRRMN